MTHIPFQHSYAKGGSACYIADHTAELGESARGSGGLPTATSSAPPTGSSTLSYSDASSAGSTESFPSSCSDNSSEMGDFISDSRSPSDSSSKFDEVRPASRVSEKVAKAICIKVVPVALASRPLGCVVTTHSTGRYGKVQRLGYSSSSSSRIRMRGFSL